MTENTYLQMFKRLQPCTEWRGGRITDTDLLTLSEAASMASKHAEMEVTPADFLRAAARGEIALRAIVHHDAKVQGSDGEVFCNAGTEIENIVPSGSIPTLPITACQHLAATGRARWRTFDGFKEIDSPWNRYTKGRLLENEPDFVTVPDDCRVTGNDVHALADAFKNTQREQKAQAAPLQQPAPAGPPKRILKKKFMVEQHKREWPTIESDLKEANKEENRDLHACMVPKKHGFWYVDCALAWAETRGKLKQPAKVHELQEALTGKTTMEGLPRRTHKMKG